MPSPATTKARNDYADMQTEFRALTQSQRDAWYDISTSYFEALRRFAYLNRRRVLCGLPIATAPLTLYYPPECDNTISLDAGTRSVTITSTMTRPVFQERYLLIYLSPSKRDWPGLNADRYEVWLRAFHFTTDIASGFFLPAALNPRIVIYSGETYRYRLTLTDRQGYKCFEDVGEIAAP